MRNQIKSALFAAQSMFQKSTPEINVVVTQAILDFCNMELLQGGKCLETHSAFRIRTDVGLGLINCVLISLAFILLQSIIFVGYSAVGVDGGGDILTHFNPIFLQHSCVSPFYIARFSTVSVDSYNPAINVSAVKARSR